MKCARTPTMAWAIVALLFLPLDAAAQVRGLVRAGVYAPVSRVGRVQVAGTTRELGRRRPSFAWGGAVELGAPDRTSYRVNGLYGVGGEIPVTGSGCGAATCRARSSLLTVTASAVLRPLPAGAFVQPHLLLGGGLERHDHDFVGDEEIDRALDDGPAPVAQLGVGVEWTLGILRGVLEVSDFVGGSVRRSEQGGGLRHDLFVTLGLTLG